MLRTKRKITSNFINSVKRMPLKKVRPDECCRERKPHITDEKRKYFNAAAQLERTLRSVERQCYPHWEIIVQDGGSTDGTLEILESHRASVSWVSEPDRGIYDAWNKAVARAGGDWALFLGADDFLMNDNVLAQCVHFLKRLDDGIVFAYGVLLMGANGKASGILDRSRHEGCHNDGNSNMLLHKNPLLRH